MRNTSGVALIFYLLANSVQAQWRSGGDPILNAPLSAPPPPDVSTQPCNPARSLLDPVTHRFRSDCNARQWCEPQGVGGVSGEIIPLSSSVETTLPMRRGPPVLSLPSDPFASLPTSDVQQPPGSPAPLALGFCVDKGCRRDEFPFGYRGVPFEQLPSLCGLGQYCPDDESRCQPRISLGKTCLINRDDSCDPVVGIVYETMCLQGLCRLADVGLNQVCSIDKTDYLGYNGQGIQVTATVMRDDCQRGLYCDESTSLCHQEKWIGHSCTDNRECLHFHCNPLTQLCEKPLQSFHQMPLWSWPLIVSGIIITLSTLVFSLYQVHLRHRANRTEEVDRFFTEQWQYRNAILSMHAAAAVASAKSAEFESRRSRESNFSGDFDQEKDITTLNDDDDDLTLAGCIDVKNEMTMRKEQAYTSSVQFGESPTSTMHHASTGPSPRRVSHNNHPSS